MQSSKDFLRSYNNKDVNQAFEALQKMVEFCQNNGIDRLKVGSTLSNSANICLHSSVSADINPLKESDEDLLSEDNVNVKTVNSVYR